MLSVATAHRRKPKVWPHTFRRGAFAPCQQSQRLSQHPPNMSTIPRLDEQLAVDTQRFERRRSMLIFRKLHYRATGEQVVEGFRYFACESGVLLAAFAAQDFARLVTLPFALDEDGEPDTSGLLIDLAYTESGAFVAAQCVEHQDDAPTPISATLLLEGAQAKALFPTIKQIDQSA